MPSQLPRVQTLMQPAVHASVLTLANRTNRTQSNMCALLIEEALQHPKWQALLETADPTEVVAPYEDTRANSRAPYYRQPSAKAKTITPENIKELQKLLGMLEALKA